MRKYFKLDKIIYIRVESKTRNNINKQNFSKFNIEILINSKTKNY